MAPVGSLCRADQHDRRRGRDRLDGVEDAVLTMATDLRTLSAAGVSDVGRQRDVNEDRCHVDSDRGVFVVIDGVGGQAAGGRAADTALAMIRKRLERPSGTVAERVREAVTIANNEVHRLASQRSEWHGMACVLTVAVVDDDRLVIGHVGDTRLYKIRHGRLEKITSDHSPVGEREDAREISEIEAMQHPRRNEVYRDVGSEPHLVTDADFVEIREVPFEVDAAVLICSDGLTDLVPSDEIRRIVQQHGGRCEDVVRGLVNAANDAGGKDNITAIFITRPQFAASVGAKSRPSAALVLARVAAIATGLAVVVGITWWLAGWPFPEAIASVLRPPVPSGPVVVQSGESITAAIDRAPPGAVVMVPPGEYVGQVRLKNGVRLEAQFSRQSTIRLPGSAAEDAAAVVADGISGAELSGFRIIGDAATPLGFGIQVRNASVRIVNVEVQGARSSALDLGGSADVHVIGSAISSNPGAALIVRSGATPRLTNNNFAKNRSATPGAAWVTVEGGGLPELLGNIFDGVDAQRVWTTDAGSRATLERANYFVNVPPATPPAGRRGGGRGR
jgi:PPM family protein phosphatase